jgi:hypothetical protein
MKKKEGGKAPQLFHFYIFKLSLTLQLPLRFFSNTQNQFKILAEYRVYANYFIYMCVCVCIFKIIIVRGDEYK